MNKRAEWNIGFGTAFVLGGIYLLTRGAIESIIFGIIIIGLGAWLISM